MRIRIITDVNQSVSKVFEGFNETLFLQLSPPFPPVKLLRFDGCKKRDEVHLQLSFIFFKQQWISVITEFQNNEGEIYFIDEGISLPFFLKSWKHKHLIKTHQSTTQIIDDIEFSTGTTITNMLFYPLLYLQFLYRKPIYKKLFK
jgi:ligand-binding SRPBCC domain-containing protein